MTFKPFDDDTLAALEERFDRIHDFAPAPRPKSRWAKASAPDPTPAYEVVFRPANAEEWRNAIGNAHHEKMRPVAAKNLTMATVVAVSFLGTQTVIDIDVSRSDLRSAQKPVREAWEAVLREYPGAPEAVVEALGELNGNVRDASEKD